METLIIDENFKDLKKNEFGNYEFYGSIEFDGSIEINLKARLIIKGGIEAGGRIVALGGGIEAGGRIVARGGGIVARGGGIVALGGGIEARGGGIVARGGGIEARGGGIVAALTVRCKKTLSFKSRIFAGTATWKKTTPEEQIIECEKIEGEIGYGTLRLLEKKKVGDAS